MGRKIADISKEALIVKIYSLLETYEDSWRIEYETGQLLSLTPRVQKDLSKVEFDNENVHIDDYPGMDGLLGATSIQYKYSLWKKITFYGVIAGGDWECPIYFIIYFDGKELRGYIPGKGNYWNTDTKQAYGNNEDADEKNLIKRFSSVDTLSFDPEKITKDIQKRLDTIFVRI